jgi:hypothetical protein
MSNGTDFPMLPTWDEMDFSRNCTAYGNFLASFLMPNPWNPREAIGGSYMLGIQFFYYSKPDTFQYPNSSVEIEALFEDITAWYIRNIYDHYDPVTGYWYKSDDFLQRVIWDPIKSCPAAYCKALGYSGNADLTGIGVFCSYYVEAGLATAYLLAYTIWQIEKWKKIKKTPGAREAQVVGEMPEKKKNRKKHGLPLSRRINDSFRGSLDSFLTATMLMSVVLLGAAIYISGERVHQNSPDNTQEQLPYLSSAIYDTVLSLLASVFSVFPVMLLYALMGRHGVRQKKKGHAGRSPDVHRVWLRRCVLGLIWAMAATQVYLAPRGDLSYWERHDPDADQYTDFCDQRGGTAYWNGLKAGQFLVVGAPLLWLFLTTFLITGFGIPGIQDRPWVVKWRSVWRLGIAWLNMLLMWGILGYFTRLRHKIIHTAGGLDNEDTWSFGQILALATWVPVLAEFVYIFIWGIEESLGTHMPVGFRVSRHDKPDPIDFSVATMGVDPYGDNVPLMGLKPTFTSEASPLQHAIPVMPGQTPFSPGAPSTSVYTTGYPPSYHSDLPEVVQQQQQQQRPQPATGYQPYYDSGPQTAVHTRTPWEQWNATGW